MGVVSPGPGDKATHKDMEQYFGTPPTSPLDAFNTSTAVFHDWEKDFMTQETVTMTQSYAIWLLALASDTVNQAPPDSSVPEDRLHVEADSVWSMPLDQVTWYVYSDADGGGTSTAEWLDQSLHRVQLTPQPGASDVYAGFGFSLPPSYRDLSAFDGMRIHGFFTKGLAFRVDFAMSSIDDYDYHGTEILGDDKMLADIPFDCIAQQGFGVQQVLDLSSLKQLNINYINTSSPATAQIDSIIFYRLKNTVVTVQRSKMNTTTHRWSRRGNIFVWNENTPVEIRMYNLLGKVLWKKQLQSGIPAVLPRYTGMAVLTIGNGVVVDRFFGY